MSSSHSLPFSSGGLWETPFPSVPPTVSSVTFPSLPPVPGEKRHCFDANYNPGYMYEKENEMMQTRMMDQAINNAISYLGAEALRPLVQTPPAPTSEMVPVISSVYPIALTRADMPNGAPQELEKKRILLPEKIVPSERGLSPNNSAQDSTDTDSNHEDRQNHIYQQSHVVLPQARNGMPLLKEVPRSFELLKPPPILLFSLL